jgi:hypothetical protein
MAYFVERYDRASLIWELPQDARAYKSVADASRRADHVNSTERDGRWAHMERWARVVDENRRVWTPEMVENGGPVTTHALVCPNCGEEVR